MSSLGIFVGSPETLQFMKASEKFVVDKLHKSVYYWPLVSHFQLTLTLAMALILHSLLLNE